MRLFSYRNRARFAKAALVIGVILAVLLAMFWIAVAYLDRYIVYDQNGAHLDPDWQENSNSDMVLTPSVEVDITYLDADTVLDSASRPITGYYVTTDMLQDLHALEDALADESIYAVMFDMKNDYGTCYFPTSRSNAPVSSAVDIEAVAELIDTLSNRGVHLIARIPAFVDYTYSLAHVELGLPVSGGALWSDENGNYWMDPANSSTIGYLEQICMDLQDLGFDEIVFDRFRFPDTTSIVYDETDRTKTEVIANAARALQSSLTALDLDVSFGIRTDTAFPYLLTGEHLYFQVTSGTDIDSIAALQAESVTNTETQLVFLSASQYSAIESYGHLYPAPIQTTESE